MSTSPTRHDAAGTNQESRLALPGSGVWFPAIRAGTGVDVFTQRLCEGLIARGIRAHISWLPGHAEYLPWAVSLPEPPHWATIAHVNTWLHRRFVPAKLPVVATMHHSVHDKVLTPYKTLAQKLYHRQWVRPMEAWMLNRANAVATVSHYSARMVSEGFGIDSPHVIYNGMPSPAATVPLDRRRHKPFRLLYVGSWSRRKGVDMLGPIMEKLGDDFVLHYTSGTGARSGLPANCVSLGRPSRGDLEEAYLQSDALLFPTRLEGFGQVALEAMAFGLPVIATRCSAIPEVVDDGRSGLLCEPDDVDAFVAAARRFADDESLWLSMRRAAILRAGIPSFGIDSMVDGYLALYDVAMNAYRPHGQRNAPSFGKGPRA